MVLMVLVPLRKLGPGLYQTRDGRFNIERQDGETECDHPLCDQLHRKYHTPTGDGRGSMHWLTYVSWHIWDNELDDYPARQLTEYYTKREAHAALSRMEYSQA